MGASARLIGPVGSDSVAKLVNQMIVANTTAVVCKAFTFARKEGVDPKTVFEAIRGGAAGSAVLDMKLPQMLAHDFTPPSAVERRDKTVPPFNVHELDHAEMDAKNGSPGITYYLDHPETRAEMEEHAYGLEIEKAESDGYTDLAMRLRELLDEEVSRIEREGQGYRRG
jgi:hypothetical protein